jgi:hypothetical protein
VRALHHRDARTVCEILFPFGEHQPASALPAALTHLNSPTQRAKYAAYVRSCAPAFARHASNFTGYAQLFANLRLGQVEVHGNTASARVTAPTGRRGGLIFVKAAGEWRVLVGVQ